MSLKLFRFPTIAVLFVGLLAILGRPVAAQFSTVEGAAVATDTSELSIIPSQSAGSDLAPAALPQQQAVQQYRKAGEEYRRAGQEYRKEGQVYRNAGQAYRGALQLNQAGDPFALSISTESRFNYSGSQDPEMIKLVQADHDIGQRARQLAQKIRKGKPGPEGVDQKDELSKLVNGHFDVRQKRRELELKRLEEQLSRLREVIKRRSDSRELIVGKRLSEMLGEQYELDF